MIATVGTAGAFLFAFLMIMGVSAFLAELPCVSLDALVAVCTGVGLRAVAAVLSFVVPDALAAIFAGVAVGTFFADFAAVSRSAFFAVVARKSFGALIAVVPGEVMEADACLAKAVAGHMFGAFQRRRCGLTVPALACGEPVAEIVHAAGHSIGCVFVPGAVVGLAFAEFRRVAFAPGGAADAHVVALIPGPAVGVAFRVAVQTVVPKAVGSGGNAATIDETLISTALQRHISVNVR